MFLVTWRWLPVGGGGGAVKWQFAGKAGIQNSVVPGAGYRKSLVLGTAFIFYKRKDSLHLGTRKKEKKVLCSKGSLKLHYCILDSSYGG